jgi:hypothetical protein
MKIKTIVATLLAVLLASMFLLSPVYAACNLPASATVTVAPGQPPVQITLTGFGAGYDVTAGVPYTGYCIELGEEVIQPIEVTLACTDAAGSPWNQINWLLNNYPDSLNLQKAIWLLQGNTWADLIAGGWGPELTAVNDMVSAASTHGTFDPSAGDWVGVRLVTDGGQDLLIKIQIPSEGEPGLTPGFWKNNLAVYLHLAKGNRGYSNPEGATEVTKDTMGDFFAALDDTLAGPYDLMQLYRDLCPQLDGITAQIRNEAANIFNVAAGLAQGPPWN